MHADAVPSAAPRRSVRAPGTVSLLFFSAALAAFLVHALGGGTPWFRAGVYANVAGVVAALIASLPTVLEPGGLALARTAGLALVLGVFTANLAMHWDARHQPAEAGTPVLLCAAGLLIAGLAPDRRGLRPDRRPERRADGRR